MVRGHCDDWSIRGRSCSGRKGFTLIELMIVVVIIGILAALAIPRFFQATTKTRQSEAKLILKQICTNQMLYRAANPLNQYYTSGATGSSTNQNAFAAIDVSIPANAVYSYTIVAAGNDFTATATANLDDDATNDVWTIHADGHLANTSNDATN